MDMTNFKEKMKIAKELASQEEEPFKIAAYQTILNKLLEEFLSSDNLKPVETTNIEKPQHKDLITANEFLMILNEIDIEHLSVINNLNSVLDKSLVLLNHINQFFPNNPGLSIEEIQKILFEKFGLTTITDASIRMALKRVTGKYVTRTEVKDGKIAKHKYKILTQGREYAKGLKSD